MDVVSSPAGIHPKLSGTLEKVFAHLQHIGGEIGREKRRKTMPRTWRDSTQSTMFLD
jgi:hypothetical protein